MASATPCRGIIARVDDQFLAVACGPTTLVHSLSGVHGDSGRDSRSKPGSAVIASATSALPERGQEARRLRCPVRASLRLLGLARGNNPIHAYVAAVHIAEGAAQKNIATTATSSSTSSM